MNGEGQSGQRCIKDDTLLSSLNENENSKQRMKNVKEKTDMFISISNPRYTFLFLFISVDFRTNRCDNHSSLDIERVYSFLNIK